MVVDTPTRVGCMIKSMTTQTAAKFIIAVGINRPRPNYFRSVKNGRATFVRRPDTAKTFTTEADAQKYADILFRLTMVSYKVVAK